VPGSGGVLIMPRIYFYIISKIILYFNKYQKRGVMVKKRGTETILPIAGIEQALDLDFIT